MKGFFVTGTDTGIGKTIVSAALMNIFRRQEEVCYWKPIQTGIEEDNDTETVRNLARCSDEEVHDQGVRLEKPLSPHLSARLANENISVEKVLSDWGVSNDEDDSSKKVWIVEGAGGILVPLNEKELMIDLMKAIRFPAIIAARSGLGTINHTLLTIEKLQQEKGEEKTVSITHNLKYRSGSIESICRIIEEYGGITLLPYLATLHKSEWERQFVRYFENPPHRQVIFLTQRGFEKQKLIDLLKKENTFLTYKWKAQKDPSLENKALFVVGNIKGIKIKDSTGITVPVIAEYSNADTILTFPFTYQDSGKCIGEWGIDLTSIGQNIQYKVTYNREWEVEGWGTLITPYQTHTNVLKIKTTLDQVDSVIFLGTPIGVPRKIVEYTWYDANFGLPVMKVDGIEALGFTTFSTAQYYDTRIVGTGEINNEIEVSIYPNPTNDFLTISSKEIEIENLFF